MMSDSKSTIEIILETRWLSHSIFWISLFVLSTFYKTAVYNQGSLHYFTIDGLAILMPQMLCAYVLTYYLVPKFLAEKKYIRFVIFFLMLCYGGALIARLLVVYGAEPIIRPRARPETVLRILIDFRYLIAAYVPSMFFYPVLMAAVKSSLDRYREQERFEKLERENTKTELAMLKSQVHPHFLLNTLNNLYALTLKKSDQAPETVIRLSELLTYTLYKTDAKVVPLGNEIKLLENYVALEELRYGEALDLEMETNDAERGFMVAPLILLPLVENAFKHGVSEKIEDAKIRIEIRTDDQSLKMKVFNTREPNQSEDKQEYRKGIGLSNLRKQLELIYPKSHVLEIVEGEDSFEVVMEVGRIDVED